MQAPVLGGDPPPPHDHLGYAPGRDPSSGTGGLGRRRAGGGRIGTAAGSGSSGVWGGLRLIVLVVGAPAESLFATGRAPPPRPPVAVIVPVEVVVPVPVAASASASVPGLA